LQEKGFESLTPVQEKSILPALQGKDIVVSSKTGSGKTLAFLVPALHRLLTNKALSRQDPRVLILAPTRELAKQVFLEVKSLGQKLSITSSLIVGGENYNDQVKALRRNPHVIVGTAGRIADHLTGKSFYLNGLELLIFDEADRMLDLGFANELTMINKFADHRKRQTMLFSATLDNIELGHLSKSLLNAPVRISIGASTEAHQDISQSLYFTDNVTQKDELLQHLLGDVKYNQAIVFTATRQDTQRIADALCGEQLDAIALRGDFPQNKRANIMSAFSRGQHTILVTTDVASRGLDLSKVGLVVNYDLPKQADEYIHRIGRTGRAGHKGIAISFVGPRDWKSYQGIRDHVDYEVNVETHPTIQAKFNGFTSRQAGQFEAKLKGANATSNTDAVKPKVNKGKKRIDNMSGEDIGALPVRKKKLPPEILDDDDE
jgi:superfamily II DNA/RNA helicase